MAWTLQGRSPADNPSQIQSGANRKKRIEEGVPIEWTCRGVAERELGKIEAMKEEWVRSPYRDDSRLGIGVEGRIKASTDARILSCCVMDQGGEHP
jgi:hypothetical protein